MTEHLLLKRALVRAVQERKRKGKRSLPLVVGHVNTRRVFNVTGIAVESGSLHGRFVQVGVVNTSIIHNVVRRNIKFVVAVRLLLHVGRNEELGYVRVKDSIIAVRVSSRAQIFLSVSLVHHLQSGVRKT